MYDYDEENRIKIETCNFVTTSYGVVVYDHKGSFIGKYPTDDEATDAIREEIN